MNKNELNQIFAPSRNYNYDKEGILIIYVSFIGDNGIGKTSHILEFMNERTNTSWRNYNIDFKIKTIEWKEKKVKIMMRDPNGQERFGTLSKWLYNYANGLIIGYSVTNLQSFKNVEHWIEDSEKYLEKDNHYKILIGYKCDDEMNRKVSYQQGKELADKLGLDFFEVSSFMRINVEESMHFIVDKIMTMKCENEISFINNSIELICESLSKEFGDVLFDTSKDNWSVGKCSIGDKLLNKRDILIIIKSDQYLFGCYYPSIVNTIGKYCESNDCFIVSFNNKKTYPIKPKQKALIINKYNEEKLLTIGKEDIVIYKQEKKDQCYCIQTSFDYGTEKNVLIGKEGKKNQFIVDHITVFQMI